MNLSPLTSLAKLGLVVAGPADSIAAKSPAPAISVSAFGTAGSAALRAPSRTSYVAPPPLSSTDAEAASRHLNQAKAQRARIEQNKDEMKELRREAMRLESEILGLEASMAEQARKAEPDNIFEEVGEWLFGGASGAPDQAQLKRVAELQAQMKGVQTQIAKLSVEQSHLIGGLEQNLTKVKQLSGGDPKLADLINGGRWDEAADRLQQLRKEALLRETLGGRISALKAIDSTTLFR